MLILTAHPNFGFPLVSEVLILHGLFLGGMEGSAVEGLAAVVGWWQWKVGVRQ